MAFFSKNEMCPLCNNKIGLTRLKFKLNNGEFICQNCVTDLEGMFKRDQEKLLPMTVEQIKEKYHQKGYDVFRPTKKIGSETTFMAFDEVNKMFSVKQSLLTPEYKGKYSEILSYEVVENNNVKTKSGLGKAVAGTIIAGPAGMIAGAVIGKGQQGPEMINSLFIKITIKPGTNYPLSFISKPIKSNSIAARNALSDIDRITEILDKIIPVKKDTSATQERESNEFDKIKEFKELLDLGIISQEEFDAKKKELLGL